MTIDFSNKRNTTIFAAVLLIFAASIIFVIVLGIWDFNMHSTPDFESGDQTSTSVDDWECIKEHPFVPGAQIAFDINHDVKAGWMEIQYDIPFELPICLTEEYVDQNFQITVWSYGGYHPDDLANNYMALYQPKTGKGGLIEITWDNGMAAEGCATMIYSASFDIVGGSDIIFDSNHLPSVITNGADQDFIVEAEPTMNLDKWVDISVFSSWAGCRDPNQEFKLILAQDYNVL
jgi:hypothetical protein